MTPRHVKSSKGKKDGEGSDSDDDLDDLDDEEVSLGSMGEEEDDEEEFGEEGGTFMDVDGGVEDEDDDDDDEGEGLTPASECGCSLFFNVVFSSCLRKALCYTRTGGPGLCSRSCVSDAVLCVQFQSWRKRMRTRSLVTRCLVVSSLPLY